MLTQRNQRRREHYHHYLACRQYYRISHTRCAMYSILRLFARPVINILLDAIHGGRSKTTPRTIIILTCLLPSSVAPDQPLSCDRFRIPQTRVLFSGLLLCLRLRRPLIVVPRTSWPPATSPNSTPPRRPAKCRSSCRATAATVSFPPAPPRSSSTLRRSRAVDA